MAIYFNGSTSTLRYEPLKGSAINGCYAFWIRTTQTDSQAIPISQWSYDSREGAAFVLNNPGSPNILLAIAYDATSNAFAGGTLSTTSAINTGQWIHIAFNFSTVGGQPSELYVNGVQEGSAIAANSWYFSLTASPLILGKLDNPFWVNPFEGDLAEVYINRIRKLNPQEIQALASGFAPKQFLSYNPGRYMPLVRQRSNRTESFITADIDTTETDHPRVFGGYV